jgi:hypothetical protein
MGNLFSFLSLLNDSLSAFVEWENDSEEWLWKIWKEATVTSLKALRR